MRCQEHWLIRQEYKEGSAEPAGVQHVKDCMCTSSMPTGHVSCASDSPPRKLRSTASSLDLQPVGLEDTSINGSWICNPRVPNVSDHVHARCQPVHEEQAGKERDCASHTNSTVSHVVEATSQAKCTSQQYDEMLARETETYFYSRLPAAGGMTEQKLICDTN